MNLKEIMNEKMKKLIYADDKIKVKFSVDKKIDHSLESRLTRANITNDKLISDLKNKIISKLDKSGIYLIKNLKDEYQIIGKYNKKELYIYTILTKDMIAKDFDYEIIVEWIKECFGITINENEFRIIKEGNNDICIENKEIYSPQDKFFVIEV